MQDPMNPTDTELRQWAQDPQAMAPTEDWDLILTDPSRIVLIFELAADISLPTRLFFLRCLYLYIGDFVRAHHQDPQWEQGAFKILNLGKQNPQPDIRLWADRASDLLQNPSSFHSDDWCNGYLLEKK